jgi:hypothetical protein
MTFDDHFERDARAVTQMQDLAPLASVEPGASGLTDFLSTHAGGSYERGLYRIYSVADMQRWTAIAAEAFPDFRQRILCFGSDWLGRIFALDFARKSNGQFLVLMLEPGTGQALEIPATFMDFHNQELVQYQNEALAVEFYRAWQASGGEIPAFEQCAGYKKALFLNGSDTAENLEITDMEVYWSIAGQLLSKIRGLPEGTRLDSIRIND